MSWILLSNDDGIDSPALGPFAAALGHLGEVRVVVPDGERSWIGKAITRHGTIEVMEDDRFGIPTLAVSGYPADAVQVGAAAFDTPPSLVVAGVNLGYNNGAGYMIGSGTVGAAMEGWELGLPSYAFSAGSVGVWNEWHAFASSGASLRDWERIADLCADLLGELLEVDMPGDVINVNVPWLADETTPRKVTTVARVAYGQLHHRTDGGYSHQYTEDFILRGPLDGTDVEVNRAGEIAITPIMMPQSPDVSDDVRAALER